MGLIRSKRLLTFASAVVGLVVGYLVWMAASAAVVVVTPVHLWVPAVAAVLAIVSAAAFGFARRYKHTPIAIGFWLAPVGPVLVCVYVLVLVAT